MKTVKKQAKSKKTITRKKKIPTIAVNVVNRGSWTSVHSAPQKSKKWIGRTCWPKTLPFEYDDSSDSGYLYFSQLNQPKPRVFKTVEVGNFILDLNKKGQIIGIEILNVQQQTVFRF